MQYYILSIVSNFSTAQIKMVMQPLPTFYYGKTNER